MRRFTTAIGIAAVAPAATGITAEPQQSRAAFGRWCQVWGTWVWRTQVSSSAPSEPSLLTLHIDGTVSVSDGHMFGNPTAANRRFLTPLHGVWEKTGFQSIGGTSLWLSLDPTTGASIAWGRARTPIEFADDFDHFQGKMFLETLPCAAGPPVNCPDPQDPAAKWAPNPNMPPDGFPISGTRLARVPAGPLP